MPFGETFIVINLVACLERVCVCVRREAEHKLGYNICLCKPVDGVLETKCTLLACNHVTLCSMPKCFTIGRNEKNTNIVSNMQGRLPP